MGWPRNDGVSRAPPEDVLLQALSLLRSQEIPQNPQSCRRRISHGLQAPRFNFEFANLVLLNLARERGREVIDETDVLGNLVVGDLALTELANRLLSSRHPRPQAYPGHHDLAQAGIGNSHHLHLVHLGVRVKELLYLAGVGSEER